MPTGTSAIKGAEEGGGILEEVDQTNRGLEGVQAEIIALESRINRRLAGGFAVKPGL
jgi:hypothetical protein